MKHMPVWKSVTSGYPALDHRWSPPNLCWAQLMMTISSQDLTLYILLVNQLSAHHTLAKVSFAFPLSIGEEES